MEAGRPRQGEPALRFAHVTNHMALSKGDFTKGEADGTEASPALWQPWQGRGMVRGVENYRVKD